MVIKVMEDKLDTLPVVTLMMTMVMKVMMAAELVSLWGDQMMTSSGLMPPSDPLSQTNDTQTHFHKHTHTQACTYIMVSCCSIDLACHLCWMVVI